MKKWIIFMITAILVAIAITGFMYSSGMEIIDDDVMYMVSHSEYWSGEEGQIVARLYNWQGNPITVDNCTVDIYNPNKTMFISGAVTDDSLQATTGTHYYNFTTPTLEGVYQYMATCSYNSKTRSVANSFHLSPALNFQLDINNSITTLTAQELAHYIDNQANLSTIISDIAVVDGNVDQLLLDVADVNVSVTDAISDIASVQTDTTFIRANMMDQDNITIITNKQEDILNNLTAIKQFCDDIETNTSQLCVWVSLINDQVIEINTTIGNNDIIIAEINATTHSTFDYMTGTLATNINTLLGTTSRIETNTVQINDTVNEIKTNVTSVITNQQDIVYMEAFS